MPIPRLRTQGRTPCGGNHSVRRRPVPRLVRRAGCAVRGAPGGRRRAALARRSRSEGRRRRDHPRRVLVRRLSPCRCHRPVRARDGRDRPVRPQRRVGAGDLQRLPGAVRGGAAVGCVAAEHVAAVRLPAGRRGSGERGHSLDGGGEEGPGALDPGQAHDRPLLGAGSGARRARGQRPGGLAVRRRAQLQRLGTRHRRRLQRSRERAGADAASRARGRRADRLGRRARADRRAGVRHRELGLTDHEYDLIVEKLGREPNEVEIAVFSLMWSEHCGYKHSRRLLKTLPTEGGRLVLGPGENAGAVDIGSGMAPAFKVEAHTPPSAVEPFQGAATGVGVILRDVFAIGARPVAILDSLRFGEVAESARSRYLLEHAVAGIGHYGNSIGVATVGGEIYFEGPYEQNCLVNAMCVGLIQTDKLIRSAAAGVGNIVVLFGAKTGRDGIGGASVLASAELGEADGDKRPTVQIGDPFEEKKLLECSLELLDAGLLVALQDLGAAGLTSSASEMAAKGGVGLELDVRRVPLREADMEPFEIMISESQERMLCVVEPDRLDAVLAVCARWEVNATAIGEVTEGDRLRVFDGETLGGGLPVAALVDECPAYDLEPVEPSEPLYPAPPRVLTEGLDGIDTLLALLGSANLASRRWAFEQYDY